MTFFAQQDAHNPKQVKVSVTYGSAEFHMTEDAAHLRVFHGELGRLLDKVETEQVPPHSRRGAA